ncbi:MAG TPA: 4-alpha-glucanotransferase [Anaeromyxobacter sp.]|nr:4-alpha-glucanotransferase [Anaeromyxobacter sp.]
MPNPAGHALPDVLRERQAGVLLHPTSLPGPYGIGDLGPEARRFAEWLGDAGARFWQVLPLGPPAPAPREAPVEDCPYVSWASLAGNPWLLSLDDLRADGLLEAGELDPPGFGEGPVDFLRVYPWKRERLRRAADRLLAGRAPGLREALEQFRAEAGWARDAALYAAASARQGGAPWWTWPAPLRERDPAAVAALAVDARAEVDRGIALQFLFERQWAALRAHARARGVLLFGDVPIYVSPDSADVWASPGVFDLRRTPDGELAVQNGTPPDEFTRDGARWGGPLYDWEWMARDGYAWWRLRLSRALAHADLVRIDHFRSLSAAWAIPAGRPPREGRWVPGPALRFFEVVERHMGRLPLCAEDLGAIDADVIALRDAAGIPGMRILQFAFGGDARNPHLPHNHPEACVAYPGNHDNDTAVGWWRKLDPRARTHAQHYLGRHGDDIAWELIRACFASPARLAVIQLQDVLALDSDARMNDPESYGRLPRAEWPNWRWRVRPGAADARTAERFRFLAALYGRA